MTPPAVGRGLALTSMGASWDGQQPVARSSGGRGGQRPGPGQEGSGAKHAALLGTPSLPF